MIKDYKDVILGEIEVARVIAREIMLVDCELKDEEYKTEEDFATEQDMILLLFANITIMNSLCSIFITMKIMVC